MNNIYVDELPKDCGYCCYCFGCEEDGYYCDLDVFHREYDFDGRHPNCPLKSLKDALTEERKKVIGELKVDIRSLFDAYASSLLDYCIWSINAYTHKNLYNNFKRVIKNRLDKVLDLFDKRIDQIERGDL
jgi:hypothetical protein